MPTDEPVITTITRTEFQDRFDHLINQVAQGKTMALIEEDGQEIAALISTQDLKRFKRYEDFRVLEDFGKAFEDQTPEQIERESAKALQEARDEYRKRRPQSAMP